MRAMPSNPRRPDAPRARVCIVSLRGINKHAAWCSNYEFEDVIAGVDDVDVYSLEPGMAYEQRNWFARRMVWKPGLRLLSPFLNPGLEKVVIDRSLSAASHFLSDLQLLWARSAKKNAAG